MADANPIESNPRHRTPRPVTPLWPRRWLGFPAAPPMPIGREREVATLCALLQERRQRLVTATGPGGVGKTRLALAAAEEIAPTFADGAAFFALDAIADPALMLPTIASVLEVRETPGRSPRDALFGALREQRILLVLDNLEHLAGPSAAADVSALLHACPALTILVTSRVPLHLRDERVFATLPLAVPPDSATFDPATVNGFAAVALFVDRARAVHSGFDLDDENAAAVAGICRRLDGLPLAIELAAAWSRVLPPAALLARLEQRLLLLTRGPHDAPDRLRTMRNAVAWSYDLLIEREQTLFRRLSVFAGGFTLDAAEAVGGERGALRLGGERGEEDEQHDEQGHRAPFPPLSPLSPPLSPSVFELVAALVDHSLLRRVERGDEEPRYAMLETVREYGVEKLAAGDEDAAIRRRHAEYCVSMAEAALAVLWSSLPGAAQVTWLDRLEREHPNLRAALSWTSRHDPEMAVRLAGALSYFWWQRGHLREGMDWIQRALALRDDAPAPLQARALYAASLLTGEQGDYATGAELAAEALALYRELGDRDGMRRGIQALGIAAMEMGQLERAAALFEELLERARELGHVRAISTALVHLGGVAIVRGELDRARPLLTEAVALARQHDDRFALAWFLFKLGELERTQGDAAEAVAHVQESLQLYQEFGSAGRAGICLATLAALAEPASQPESVVRLLGAAEQFGQSESGGVLDVDLTDRDRLRTRLRARLGDEPFSHAWDAGRALTLDEAIAEAMAIAVDGIVESAATTAGRSPHSGLGLTPRERQVLALLIEGNSDRAIADALFISQRTASDHVGAILRKLDAGTRAEAAVRAVRDGIA